VVTRAGFAVVLLRMYVCLLHGVWQLCCSAIVMHRIITLLGATARSNAFYGQGTGPIHLDNLACNGSEIRITDCPSNPIGTHNCVHAEDAGVTCAPIVTTPPPRKEW
jgi:hypothetical protein